MEQVFETVVVGAGPVGLTAAIALRAQGLAVTVIEAEAEGRVRPGSRALFLHKEPLQELDKMTPGLAAKIGEEGMIWSGALITYDNKIVYQQDFPVSNYENYGTSLSQITTERILYKAAREAGVDFRWSTSLKTLDADDDLVRMTTENGEQILARYVVAADGARSTARRSLDIPLEGNNSNTAFVIIDVSSPAFQSWPVKLNFHYQDKRLGGRNLLIVPFKQGWRFDLQCKPEDNAEELATDEGCRRWLTQFDPALHDAEISWASVYRFRQLVARSFTDPHRRVLLVGEAAHLFAPFGGRGLNSGIMDVAAAALAIRQALQTEDRAKAISAIDLFAKDRRDAALFNRSIAAQGLDRLDPPTTSAKAKRWLAAQLAPWFRDAGRWLGQGPTGVAHGRAPGTTIY